MFRSWYFKYVALMGSLFLITVGYNACSNDASFDLRQGVESLETFNGGDLLVDRSPTVIIDNGASYTTEQNVNLTLSPDGLADSMVISNDPTCSGSWEPLQSNRTWSLGDANKEAHVYVSFRYQDETPTACVSDTIVHDNTAPVVNFTQGVSDLWIKDKNLNIIFEAIDNVSGIKSSECDKVGDGSFAQCGQSLIYVGIEENKSYTLTVRATDNAGNVSEPKKLNWFSDQTAPSIVFNKTPSALTADSSPLFEFLANDNGSGLKGYECRLDNAASFSSCNNSLQLSNLTDGNHQLSIRATDNVGHQSEILTYTWMQDATAPTIEFTQTPLALDSDKTPTFAFQGINAAQGIVSYRCKLDSGSYSNCSSPRSLSALADGQHSFSVIGFDAASNPSSPITYSWTIDTVKPTIAFGQTPDSLVNTQSAVISYVGSDANGIKEYQCRVDSNSFTSCAGSQSLTALSQGSHTFEVYAVDNAGNRSSTIRHTWVIDLTAPTIQITKSPDPYTKETQADFEFVATDANGVGALVCKVDGGAYAACASPEVITGLAEGSHTFTVRAVDNAGNLSTPVSHSWYVDTTAPNISFILQPDAVSYIGNTAQIRFTLDDGVGSGVDTTVCSYGGVNVSCEGDKTIDMAIDTVGDFTFQVTVTDNLGNNKSEQVTWQAIYKITGKETNRTIKGDRPVDILFVIDNSGSMRVERQNLATRINGFIEQIKDLDWQIAVTTTDIRGNNNWEAGRLTDFESGVHILDSSMNRAHAQDIFGSRVQGIPEGSGAEQGIYASVKAIERAIGNPASINAQFFRDDANLAIVILSDEDENSNGTNVQYTPQEFLDFFTVSFQGAKDVTWHSIITKPNDSSCIGNGGYSYGVVYNSLSEMTGGVVGSICENNYATQLKDMGVAVKHLQKSISLECTPVDDDGDGNLDVTVTYKAVGAADYVSFAEAYTVTGQQMEFVNYLPDGDFKVVYSCASSN